MKRLSLWLTAGFVLFSFSGGLADEQSLPPDLASLPPGVIKYDSFHPESNPFGQSLKNDSNYWIGVLFRVPNTSFTVGGAEFKVNNELLNTKDTAHLYLVKNKFVTGLPQPNWSNVFDVETVTAPFNRLQGKPLTAPQPFGRDELFWIVLGPVPGGPDDSLAEQGWWAFSDKDPNTNSYASFGDSNSWAIRPAAAGNFVLRARGDFSPPPDVVINEVMFNADPLSSDSARNHEWVELYNRGTFQSSENWWLIAGTNVPTDSLQLPNIEIPAGWYVVVHIGAPADTIEADSSVGRIDIYRQYTGEFFDNRRGACALNYGTFPLGSFLGWNLKNLGKSIPLDSTKTCDGLVVRFGATEALPLKATRIQPTEGVGPLLTATAGISIGLDSSSDNSTADLDIALENPPTQKAVTFLGGPDAAGPTMGRQNLLPMAFEVDSQLPAPSGMASWTVMLYMAADYGDDPQRSPDRWYYDILNQIEQVVSGGFDSVNVVVLFDTRRAQLLDSSGTRNATLEGALRSDATDVVRNLKLIPSEVNTGRDTTLAGFVSRAKSSYPAAHYALALKGDGAGWQGLCGDGDSGDRLEMGELKAALQAGLGSTKLDLLIFDAPLMGQLEVAAQVKDFAHVMVASPEMTGPADFDYPRLVQVLKGGPTIAYFVDTLQETALDTILKNRTGGDPSAVWAVVNLDNLDTLLKWVDTLAINLQTGVEDPCVPGASTDNYQLRIRTVLISNATDHYGTQAQGMADFIDLRSFALRARNPNHLPENNCTSHKKGADSVANLLKRKGPVIAGLEGGGTVFPGFHRTLSTVDGVGGGLSIYFPSARQRATPLTVKTFFAGIYNNDRSDHPFDTPGLATEGGVYDALRMYARDTSACYPHASGTCAGDTMAQYYPLPVVQDFKFVNSTRWDEFLIRYYKPVADAGPEQIDGNLELPITLNASGSSDADDDLSSLRYFWDLLSLEDSLDDCDSTEKEDLDKNCVNDSTDDADSTKQTFQYRFLSPGRQTIWLHVWDGYDAHLSGTARGYHTAKDSSVVDIEHRGVHLVHETASQSSLFNVYDGALIRLGIDDRCATSLPAAFDRNNIPSDRLSSRSFTCPTVIWTTAKESTTTFPSFCQIALDSALATDSMGVWTCGRLVGKDAGATNYFKGKGFPIDSVRAPVRYLVPAIGQHFLASLPILELDTTVEIPQLQSLRDTTCPVFPILKDDNGRTVAAARVLESRKHAIIFSTFGLEQLADTIDRDLLLGSVLSWLTSPDPSEECPICPAAKGDLNGVGGLTSADVVLMLNCVFLQDGTGTVGGDCNLCYTDVNCSGNLGTPDAVLELNRVFLGSTAFPWCGL